MADFLRLVFNGFTSGSAYALAALGIVLIWRTSRTTNFAQGLIGTLNAYVAAWFILSQGWSIWLASLAALVTAFATGIIIDTIIIRPAAKVSPISKQIITLGIIMVIIGIIPWFFGTSRYQMPRFIPLSQSIDVAGATLHLNTILTLVVTLGIMAVMFWFIQFTRWGLATRVTASDETTSKLMGVPTKTITMVSWATAAILGTLAAIIVAPRTEVHVMMLITVQVSAFFAGTLGGFTTFFGPVVGAFIIAFGRNFAMFYISDIWGNVLLYMSILVFLYFRPYGIFGKKPSKKV